MIRYLLTSLITLITISCVHGCTFPNLGSNPKRSQNDPPKWLRIGSCRDLPPPLDEYWTHSGFAMDFTATTITSHGRCEWACTLTEPVTNSVRCCCCCCEIHSEAKVRPILVQGGWQVPTRSNTKPFRGVILASLWIWSQIRKCTPMYTWDRN